MIEPGMVAAQNVAVGLVGAAVRRCVVAHVHSRKTSQPKHFWARPSLGSTSRPPELYKIPLQKHLHDATCAGTYLNYQGTFTKMVLCTKPQETRHGRWFKTLFIIYNHPRRMSDTT